MTSRPPVPPFHRDLSYPSKPTGMYDSSTDPRNATKQDGYADADIIGAGSPTSQRARGSVSVSEKRPAVPQGVKKASSKASRKGRDARAKGTSIEEVLKRHEGTIRGTVRTQLDAAEQHHLESLSQLSDHLASSLNVSAKQIQDIERPFSQEEMKMSQEHVQTIRNPFSGKMVPKVEKHEARFCLGDLAKGFKTNIENSTKDLERLWEQWADVQSQIISLAIEVTDGDGKEKEGHDQEVQSLLERYNRDTQMYSNIEAGIKRRQAVRDSNRDLYQNAKAIEKDITQSIANTGRANAVQQKQFEDTKRKMLREFDTALSNFIA